MLVQRYVLLSPVTAEMLLRNKPINQSSTALMNTLTFAQIPFCQDTMQNVGFNRQEWGSTKNVYQFLMFISSSQNLNYYVMH